MWLAVDVAPPPHRKPLMDAATLHILLVEARAAAWELSECQRPVTLMPAHLWSLARCLLDLTGACEQLHGQSLRWMVAAARREPPGEGL
jgi:hypothetical protein